jgi:hypothetical protein
VPTADCRVRVESKVSCRVDPSSVLVQCYLLLTQIDDNMCETANVESRQ